MNVALEDIVSRSRAGVYAADAVDAFIREAYALGEAHGTKRQADAWERLARALELEDGHLVNPDSLRKLATLLERRPGRKQAHIHPHTFMQDAAKSLRAAAALECEPT